MQYHDFGKGAIHGRGLRVSEGDGAHVLPGTVEDGNPRVRPFGTIDLYEGRLYIQTGKNKKVYRQILDHPEVELCACAGPKWLRVTGELVPDDSVEAKKHMLDNYPALRGMYDENDDNTIVLYFKNATATFESLADGSKRTIGW